MEKAKSKKIILGVYENPDSVMHAVKDFRKAGKEIYDVFTPFPIHGLDKAMGVKRSNLTVGAFICGSIGFCLGLLLIYWTNFIDWPINVGGKPIHEGITPAFVPVTFEATVLCTAFGMAFLFFTRTKMIWGIREDIIDLRQTDDYIIMAIEGDKPGMSNDEINKLMVKNGAIEIREREYTK